MQKYVGWSTSVRSNLQSLATVETNGGNPSLTRGQSDPSLLYASVDFSSDRNVKRELQETASMRQMLADSVVHLRREMCNYSDKIVQNAHDAIRQDVQETTATLKRELSQRVEKMGVELRASVFQEIEGISNIVRQELWVQNEKLNGMDSKILKSTQKSPLPSRERSPASIQRGSEVSNVDHARVNVHESLAFSPSVQRLEQHISKLDERVSRMGAIVADSSWQDECTQLRAVVLQVRTQAIGVEADLAALTQRVESEVSRDGRGSFEIAQLGERAKSSEDAITTVTERVARVENTMNCAEDEAVATRQECARLAALVAAQTAANSVYQASSVDAEAVRREMLLLSNTVDMMREDLHRQADHIEQRPNKDAFDGLRDWCNGLITSVSNDLLKQVAGLHEQVSRFGADGATLSKTVEQLAVNDMTIVSTARKAHDECEQLRARIQDLSLELRDIGRRVNDNAVSLEVRDLSRRVNDMAMGGGSSPRVARFGAEDNQEEYAQLRNMLQGVSSEVRNLGRVVNESRVSPRSTPKPATPSDFERELIGDATVSDVSEVRQMFAEIKGALAQCASSSECEDLRQELSAVKIAFSTVADAAAVPKDDGEHNVNTVMPEVKADADPPAASDEEETTHKSKKKKKNADGGPSAASEDAPADDADADEATEAPKAKKKNGQKKTDAEEEAVGEATHDDAGLDANKEKKKKKKAAAEGDPVPAVEADAIGDAIHDDTIADAPKEKKKKKKAAAEEDDVPAAEADAAGDDAPKEKKKKKKSAAEGDDAPAAEPVEGDDAAAVEPAPKEKKKKKKKTDAEAEAEGEG